MSQGAAAGEGAALMGDVTITRAQLAQAMMGGGGAVMHGVLQVTRTGAGGDGRTDEVPFTGYLSQEDLVNLDAALAAEENDDHG